LAATGAMRAAMAGYWLRTLLRTSRPALSGGNRFLLSWRR